MSDPKSDESIKLAMEGSGRPNRLPPIRILDILVLTTAMAAAFFLQGQLLSLIPDFGVRFEQSGVGHYGLRMLNAIPMGISLAAVFWLVDQKRITGRFFQQPGHWILGVYLWVYVGMTGFSAALQTFVEPWFFKSVIDGKTALEIVASALIFVSVWKIQGTWRLLVVEIVAFALLLVSMWRIKGIWRLLVGLVAGFHLFTACAYCVKLLLYARILTGGAAGGAGAVASIQRNFWIMANSYIVVCVLVLVFALVADLRKGTSRDWLHWAGLVPFAFEFIARPIFFVVMKYSGL